MLKDDTNPSVDHKASLSPTHGHDLSLSSTPNHDAPLSPPHGHDLYLAGKEALGLWY